VAIRADSCCIPGPVFTNLFRIKIRLKLKVLLLWTFFETFYNNLTIDCWSLIKYVLQTRLLGILSFFMKEIVDFVVATAMKILMINLFTDGYARLPSTTRGARGLLRHCHIQR